MKSKPEQFCKIILQCMERYSKDTIVKLGALLNSHERVLQFEKIIEKNLPEQELLELLKKIFRQWSKALLSSTGYFGHAV